MQETQEIWVWSLGYEDVLEEEMATHSIFLAWEIPWTEEPGGLQSMGLQRVGHDWATEHTYMTMSNMSNLSDLQILISIFIPLNGDNIEF